jgi:hypothetical protein
MNVSLHTTIKRTGLALVMTSTLVAVAVGSALAVDRPAASFYTKQQLETMSQSWAARARFERDRPAASFYTPQQLKTMSDSWAARARYERERDRPAASFYTPQQLQTMSQSWAARARYERDRPAASFYTPQQLQTMSESWAARGGVFSYHPAPRSSAVVPASRGGLDWGDFGIGVAAMFGLVLLAGGLAAGVHHSRKGRVQPRPAS